MKFPILLFVLLGAGLLMPSCVSKKKFRALEADLAKANEDLGKCGISLNDYMARLGTCQQELRDAQNTGTVRQSQIDDLREQLNDCKAQRDKQLSQVGDLTVLSQSANENIKETLRQLEAKEKYIHLLQAAKSKADSINLALSVNLKQVLRDGIEDEDVEIKVDKTVVFINLSDKMLFQTGKYVITPKANEVLGKIARIVESRPDVLVMVEGYTDNVPIKTSCLDDNWDLSVKRATSVVRALQTTHKVDPNRLVAAGRGEWNTLASNDTAEGRQTNRRTRIIIMPKLDQFYDLLDPNKAPK
jgi:chemotaxis protein MotB